MSRKYEPSQFLARLGCWDRDRDRGQGQGGVKEICLRGEQSIAPVYWAGQAGCWGCQVSWLVTGMFTNSQDLRRRNLPPTPHSRPIRGQHPGLVITMDQSETILWLEQLQRGIRAIAASLTWASHVWQDVLTFLLGRLIFYEITRLCLIWGEMES